MKKLAEYREEILANRSNPSQLSQLSLELGADYAFWREQYAEYRIKMAKFMNTKKKDKCSDTYSENLFIETEDGEYFVRIKNKLRGIEGLQKALTNINITNHLEAKNQI